MRHLVEGMADTYLASQSARADFIYATPSASDGTLFMSVELLTIAEELPVQALLLFEV